MVLKLFLHVSTTGIIYSLTTMTDKHLAQELWLFFLSLLVTFISINNILKLQCPVPPPIDSHIVRLRYSRPNPSCCFSSSTSLLDTTYYASQNIIPTLSSMSYRALYYLGPAYVFISWHYPH